MSKRIEYYEYAILFFIGEVCYGLIEIMWRGHTHWTMLITGGLCVMLLHWNNIRHYDSSLWVKCAYGCFYITAVEFAAGWLINIRLGMGVWDYSDRWMNIMGQVCLLYSVFWYFLTIPAVMVSNFVIARRPDDVAWKQA